MHQNFTYFSPRELWLIQILLLARASEELEAEKAAREEEKVRYLGEKLPPLQLTGLNMEELHVRLTMNCELSDCKSVFLLYLNELRIIEFAVLCSRSSVSKFTQRLIRWMRNGTTVRPKSSRTTEMYVMHRHTRKICMSRKRVLYDKKSPAKLSTISRSMNWI